MNNGNGIIYSIVNIVNNKKYIGYTMDLKQREYHHKYNLRKGVHVNYFLQEDWNEFGEENFIFEVIESNICQESLLSREKYYTDYYQSDNQEYGYNILNGFSHNKLTREKISEKHKGKSITESQMEGLRLGHGKAYHTEETYKKLSEANRGEGSGTAKLTEEDVINILIDIRRKVPYKIIKSKYDISFSQISRIKSGKRWGYLKETRSDLYE